MKFNSKGWALYMQSWSSLHHHRNHKYGRTSLRRYGPFVRTYWGAKCNRRLDALREKKKYRSSCDGKIDCKCLQMVWFIYLDFVKKTGAFLRLGSGLLGALTEWHSIFSPVLSPRKKASISPLVYGGNYGCPHRMPRNTKQIPDAIATSNHKN